ncbi:hypothetical protein MSAN_01065500 [Mycena sanguinolenta]|uniref:Uncharacterized protein n=1 Tax=Mycena sanguinolenta TaxID=230812 RepID=A0A8H6YRW8_9AGAR|nr:hypothetical protein MSAN_01065500 [Mycena sanguinolenta]
MDLGPVLPPDLEREIFEFVAFSNIRSIPELVLVAQRVRSWIEPLLYRNLSVFGDIEDFRRDDDANLIRISTNDCLKILDSKPASFFDDHVRHLAFMRVPSDAAALILSRCGRARRLALFQTGTEAPDPSWLPSIAAMGLLHISVDVNSLFGHFWVDFDHYAFVRLTHLDLFEVPASESWTTDLCRLPRLTHLSFNFDADFRPTRKNIDATACRLILAGCKSLEVLVLVYLDESSREEFDCQYFSNDPRSVTVVVEDFLGDWERGATGRDDYWIRAESFIQKRRRGEIKVSEYAIPVDPY